MEWKRSCRPRPMNNPPIVYCLSIFFFFFFCALFSSFSSTPTCQGSTCPLSAKADVHFQKFEKNTKEERMVSIGRKETSMSFATRFLGGVGSLPPTCTSKCGECTPCERVLVQVPPPKNQETSAYNAEVWRCKCHNKLYIP